MNSRIAKHLGVIMAVLISALSPGLGAEPAATPPYYRFWRGFKKDGLPWKEFHQALVTDFMPATVTTHGQEGLMSYMVVLPISSGSFTIPEEVALVAYASEQVYKTITNTPHGKAYQQKHGDIFRSKGNSEPAPGELPGQSRMSRSLVPQSFTGVALDDFRREAAYDVLSKPVDWQAGHSAFLLGLRSRSLRPDFFFDALYKHINETKNALSSGGLRGYVVLVDPNYVMAFLNWESKEAMTKALQSPAGSSLQNGWANVFHAHMWQEFRDFDGNVQPGECVQYMFSRP